MNSKSNTFWGVVIIGIGLVVLMNMIGIQFYLATRFVHLIIGGLLILYGVSSLVQKRKNFMSFFTLYVGIGFVLFASVSQFNFLWRSGIDSPWAFIGPAAILAVGTSMLMKNTAQPQNKMEQQTTYEYSEKCKNTFTDGTDRLNIQDMFSSSVTVATSQHFQGGAISSRFSDTVVDLRQVKMTDGSILEVDNLFSSIKIIVAGDVYINVVSQTNVFASINKKKDVVFAEGMQYMTLNVNAVFGSVEIEYV